MKRDLSKLNHERSKEFLDYFHAALRSKNNTPLPPSGSGRFTEIGYEARLKDYIDSSQGQKVAVTWKLLLNPDGSMISVEAISDRRREKALGDCSA